ncbi:hypothetical protein AB1Y20_022305 [Prymnesium parvum]|uniref:Uncharacterized protein n=1 Tax=Prymnesium parvum TaxID=97485 RepID=A0AB34JHJ0_PRYPA|mmetsp:Transcript_6980/g.14637  ORF Transcript_6980/g.14637 Transcript_6980/m.14637 type:complete len:103 (-) Transcript_6980:356-664(-)
MAQGNLKLKKAEKKPKPVRGDQQKLHRGRNLQIKPSINKQTTAYAAQQAITKKIVKKIEQTMAARASTDGAGLSVVKADGGEEGKQRPLLKAPVLSQGKKKR